MSTVLSDSRQHGSSRTRRSPRLAETKASFRFCVLVAASCQPVGTIARPGAAAARALFQQEHPVPMIARNWARGDATCWQPHVDCLYAGERGMHLDYPVMSQIAAWGWRLCGGSLEVWGRATAAAFSVASVALVYALARRWHGPTLLVRGGCWRWLRSRSSMARASCSNRQSWLSPWPPSTPSIAGWRETDSAWLMAAAWLFLACWHLPRSICSSGSCRWRRWP